MIYKGNVLNLKNNVASLSEGKDSLCMLLEMIRQGWPIHSIIHFDTGWNFSFVEDHIKRVEDFIGREIIRIKPLKSLDYWMNDHVVFSKSKHRINHIGCGWPSAMRRWCTREKVRAINGYLDTVENVVSCVGIAADEAHRVKVNSKYPCRYPLIEMDIDEKAALQYCLEKGFDFGGMYGVFDRVSCFCCPLQRVGSLKKLRKHFPAEWEKMLEMENRLEESSLAEWTYGVAPDTWHLMTEWHKPARFNVGFKDYKTVHDFDERFRKEDLIPKQFKLPI